MSENDTVEVDSNALAIVKAHAEASSRNMVDEAEAERLADALNTIEKAQNDS